MSSESILSVVGWREEEQLYELTAWKRENKMVLGVVRSLKEVSYPITDANNKSVVSKKALLVIALQNGTTGICETKDFSVNSFKNYHQFVGQRHYFYIDKINLDASIFFLDGATAEKERASTLWESVVLTNTRGNLQEKTYKALVTGVAENGSGVFINIEGHSAKIGRNDWTYNSREVISVTGGEEIEVKIKLIDLEKKHIFASRKAALPDPFIFLKSLEKRDSIAGKVTHVHPVDGIFVELENGLAIKAYKRRELAEPIVGDLVTCIVMDEIKQINDGRIEGRVLITRYPKGQAVRKDLGSFLFD